MRKLEGAIFFFQSPRQPFIFFFVLNIEVSNFLSELKCVGQDNLVI